MNDTRAISEIRVGERVRKDMGDLDALAESIKERGLLQPIVIRSNGMLIAGLRRLEACKRLGRKEIEVYVRDDLDSAVELMKAERDENTCRKDFATTEAVVAAERLVGLVRTEAKKRQHEGQDRGRAVQRGEMVCGESPQTIDQGKPRPKTREIVAKAVDMSDFTYRQAKAVMKAAEDDPQAYGDLPAKMDKESPNSAYNELKRRKSGKPVDLSKYRQAKKGVSNPEGKNGRPRAGSRTVKRATSSLKQAAIDVDSVAAGFESEAYGDVSILVTYQEADEWFDLLIDAAQRLSGHIRTVKRHREATRKESNA